MSSLDWLIAAIIAVGAAVGFFKGAIRQLASIVGLLAGLLLARAFFVTVGDRLCEALDTSLTLARVLAFLLIGIGVPLCFLAIGSLLTRLAEGLRLGFMNRCLGAGLGALKYMLLLSIAIHLLIFTDSEDSLIGKTTMEQSLLYIPIKDLSGYFYPAVKDMTNQLNKLDYAVRTQ